MVRIEAVSTLGKLNVDLTELAALASEVESILNDSSTVLQDRTTDPEQQPQPQGAFRAMGLRARDAQQGDGDGHGAQAPGLRVPRGGPASQLIDGHVGVNT